MNLQVEISGHFKITAVSSDGTSRDVTGWNKNLVVNTGLDRLAEVGFFTAPYCLMGSGSTAPSAGDTTLESLVGFTSNVSNDFVLGGVTLENPYGFYRALFTFAPGVIDGNLSEIGIAHNLTGAPPYSYTLMSRALIKDGSGNPTTITILPNETVFVTYEIRYYQPLTDATGTVNISGTDYAWTTRAGLGGWGNVGAQGANVGSINNDSFARTTPAFLGDLISNGSGPISSGSNPSGSSVSTYSPGNFYIDYTTSWDQNHGDSPFEMIYINTYRGGWQMLFSPPIPKSNVNELALTYRISWANRP